MSKSTPTYRVITPKVDVHDTLNGPCHYSGDSSGAAISAHDRHPGSVIWQTGRGQVFPVTYPDGTRHLHTRREADEIYEDNARA